ncbi:MAG: DsbC family protein [Deltaproteobacteria bacterium]|nr:DsbC family protein [Deltaproteobacteria bacterium]
MLKYLLASIFLLTLAFSSPAADNAAAFQGQGCMGTCTDCHSINKEEAGKLLKADKFKANIKDIRMSPVKGIWEVEFTMEGKPGSGVVYIDFAKKFLIERATFTPLEKLGEEPPAQKIDISRIPLDKALLFGSPAATKKVIIFSDPECPYCVKLHTEIKNIIKDRPDVAFYIKMFPLETHPNAYKSSTAITCNKSNKLLEMAYAGKKLPKAKASCKTDEVDNNLKLGKELGLHGTPAIILPDGRLIPGYVPADVLLNMIDNPPAAAKPDEKPPEKAETPTAARPDEKAPDKAETPATAKPQQPSSGK